MADLAAFVAARNQQVHDVLKHHIQRLRCAILPSPEKLDTTFTSQGEDETNKQGEIWNFLFEY
jgi:hypothetical protein